MLSLDELSIYYKKVKRTPQQRKKKALTTTHSVKLLLEIHCPVFLCKWSLYLLSCRKSISQVIFLTPSTGTKHNVLTMSISKFWNWIKLLNLKTASALSSTKFEHDCNEKHQSELFWKLQSSQNKRTLEIVIPYHCPAKQSQWWKT